jgi:hypothetical protein
MSKLRRMRRRRRLNVERLEKMTTQSRVQLLPNYRSEGQMDNYIV